MMANALANKLTKKVYVQAPRLDYSDIIIVQLKSVTLVLDLAILENIHVHCHLFAHHLQTESTSSRCSIQE